ncbi:prolipoprotein diacylglyceryl transferase [Spirilliplanes yamanashiensis]|uniref:Phosphatidylglycerol--prolipoprotein diacylglyceryl transferase n=1 Tax=Spirilliplanes yamanashiensis TaxID=42233 RepID=A0A8J3Y7H8_9ACTN|nr:prolipoprotein diacylglyceryl transferase [Spirilliplanes yamanashiensis]MDP9817023.1 prolipoprotein diacylglyceryl transferase [Spirilliplanes yamanashiensis]GIJ03321.1 prolipoprotein diacylglyceryl transferase [Spirilliplanes yamanashiensis]
MTLAAIPSPSTAVWDVLGIPIRAYALCIILGIVAALLVMEYRLRRRGVAPWAGLDIAVWAVPFGIVGARIYHLITSPQEYFGSGGDPIRALYVWEGGLGIWGAVAGGAVGAWLACRQLGIPLTVAADALAPGLPLAQAIGRFGNWFNNELYGGVTTLPWGLRVHDMDRANPGRANVIDGEPVVLPELYHPTFLYEALWNLGVVAVVLLADRRWKFGRGRAFAVYVMGYTLGRVWIEAMRTDEATEFFGVRINVYVSVIVFVAALLYFLRARGPREFLVPTDAPTEAPAAPGATGDVSQVDVAGEARAPKAPPPGYQVVDEDRFLAYQRSGYLAPAADPEPAPDAGRTEQDAEAGPVAARDGDDRS